MKPSSNASETGPGYRTEAPLRRVLERPLNALFSLALYVWLGAVLVCSLGLLASAVGVLGYSVVYLLVGAVVCVLSGR